MEGVLGPRESGRFISELSQDISVDMAGVSRIAQMLCEKVMAGYSDKNAWQADELNPMSMDEKAVEWVFVADVLNFSFWSEDQSPGQGFSVHYKGKSYTGYWSLCAALNRALEEGIAITTPSFYASVDEDSLRHIFRSSTETPMPMFDERVRVLNEAGQVLMKKFQGSFVNVIKEANKSAQLLLKIVLAHFPSFQDVAEYAGKRVGMYKRAQILVSDIWGCCQGQGLGQFDDIDSLTMFPDYRVPQAMAYYGALKYSDSLMEKMNKGYMFQSGEKLEVEIRGCSIWACELVRDEVNKYLKQNGKGEELSLNSIAVDHILWNLRRDMADEMRKIPFHKCRSIFY